jgi:lipid-binding SYLF domain-containing protein
MNKKLLAILTIIPATLTAADTARERLASATKVVREIRGTSDKGVPRELLERAQCILVIPGLKKVAFIGGGKFGKGFASCMTSNGWSGPAAVRIEGGSFGLQLGASSTDVIMLVMNQGGMTKLMSDKFTVGGDASAAAGPIGRTVTANTDVLMKAEILSYSRARGLFAGLSLDGATLRPDGDVNRELYGTELTNLVILRGEVKRPAAAAAYLAQVQRFSGKGAPPAPKVVSGKHTASDITASSANPSDSAAIKPGVRTPPVGNSKNNSSDVQIAARIRRSIVDDSALSTYAHNVKVIVQNGAVTLRGPVRSDEERSSVEAKAATVAGSGKVTNELTVALAK